MPLALPTGQAINASLITGLSEPGALVVVPEPATTGLVLIGSLSTTVTEKAGSQIDSQKLVTDRLSPSSAVSKVKVLKPNEASINKGESLDLTALIPPIPIADKSDSFRFETCTAHQPQNWSSFSLNRTLNVVSEP
jgi:hypothetical protein